MHRLRSFSEKLLLDSPTRYLAHYRQPDAVNEKCAIFHKAQPLLTSGQNDGNDNLHHDLSGWPSRGVVGVRGVSHRPTSSISKADLL